MSVLENTILIEQALEIADEYEGSPLADAIRNNIERNDLEVVARLVKETEDLWLEQAYLERNNDKY